MSTIHDKALALITLFASATFLTACHSNDNNNERRSFDITVSNLTNNQPLSPVGVVLHKTGYHAWMDGQRASSALEQLAEGGDATSLLSEADANDARLASTVGSAPVGPGRSDTFQVSYDDGEDSRISVFTMLVNTNDAFTGANAVDLSQLQVGETLQIHSPAWDAGTEGNSEAAGTLPGPADSNGEGFNSARDDLDLVTIHQGVVTHDDGFSSSILDQSHRFDNPVAGISITRTE